MSGGGTNGDAPAIIPLMKLWRLILVVGICSGAAALDLRLTSGNWRPINIFVEPFVGESAAESIGAAAAANAHIFSRIIYNDLSHSGYFRGYYRDAVHSHNKVDAARYAEVRNRGGEYLLTGLVRRDFGDEEGRVFFELHDVLAEKSLGSFSINFTDSLRRTAAHKISNWVFEAIARLPGVFHTKVAYVVREADGDNLLRVADYDGYNAQTVLTSPRPLISPSWSSDGNELLYVSFEQGGAAVYLQSLLSGERRVVANFPGSNSAPAMSPDNQHIAAVLTENKGLQQIFIINAAGKRNFRETDRVNTEPAWSPDGRRLVYVSDETGSPQIYEQNIAGGAARRVSFGSRYNVSPSYSSDGGQVLYVRRDAQRRNNIAITDLESAETTMLTSIREADSPSFSPNDTMILFKNENINNSLQIISINGIILSQWEVRETGAIINPAWGPAISGWF